ncbi:MAG: DUF2380 domain-containing protein [Gammaproteobacteria bacterium]
MDTHQIDTVTGGRLALKTRGRLRQVLVGLVLLSDLGATPWAAPAPKPAHPTLLVVPFDLFDFALDERPRTVRDLHRWVGELPGDLRRDLSASGRFRVIGAHRIRAQWKKLQDSYAHPTSCPSCMADLGRRVGADYVVVGQVRKLSNLITYYQVEVDRVRDDETVYRKNYRADGADSDAMWRRISRGVARDIAQSAALSGSAPATHGASSQ